MPLVLVFGRWATPSLAAFPARLLRSDTAPWGSGNPSWPWTRDPRFESGRGNAVGDRGNAGGRQLGCDGAEVRHVKKRSARGVAWNRSEFMIRSTRPSDTGMIAGSNPAGRMRASPSGQWHLP